MSFLPTDWASFIWGAVVGAIVLFATGFFQKAGEHLFEWLRRKFASKAEAPAIITEHDRSLFNSFKTLFSNSDGINYYKEHDFLLPFRRSNLVPLNEVVECWGDESHNFVNPSLQQAKISFFKAASALAEEIARYTVPDANGNVSILLATWIPRIFLLR